MIIPTNDKPAITLLYVEDEEQTQKYVVQILRLKFPQITILLAQNGRDGLNLYIQERPDIVVTDVRMPIVDGIQMAKKIRELNQDAHIIVLSAADETNYILEAIDMDSYRAEKKAALKVTLPDEDAEIEPVPVTGGGRKPEPELDRLSNILKTFNDQFATLFTDADRVRKRISEDIAPRVANDTAYGLSAGVFGRDVTRALSVALQVDCGSVHVNGATVQNEAQAPYGGMKDSGYGRFDGRAVIDEFTELKWITLEPSVQQYPV